MKFKKILLILAILAVVSAFTISTSFAASSEKITKFDTKGVESFNIKFSTVIETSKYNNSYKVSESLKIKVKKQYKNKYKIKSVKVKFSQYGEYANENGSVNVSYKTYNFKNKNIVYLKPPKNITSDYYIDKITIFYETKSKLKNESTGLLKAANTTSTTKFYGKKSNIILKEKGYNQLTKMGIWSVTTYQSFQIKTKNPKYKINSVKILYYGPSGIGNVKTLKAYGKNKLNYKSYKKIEALFTGAFVVKYY